MLFLYEFLLPTSAKSLCSFEGKVTLLSLTALLCLHETCREQPRRADGPKHHIASSFCHSRVTDPVSPSRPLWYLLRARWMGSDWDMMCCDSRDILESLSTPSEITSCLLFFGTSEGSVSCLEYRKFKNSIPLCFICWEQCVENRLLCGIEDSRVQSCWRLMYLGVKRRMNIYIGMLKSDVPAHWHLWMQNECSQPGCAWCRQSVECHGCSQLRRFGTSDFLYFPSKGL